MADLAVAWNEALAVGLGGLGDLTEGAVVGAVGGDVPARACVSVPGSYQSRGTVAASALSQLPSSPPAFLARWIGLFKPPAAEFLGHIGHARRP